MRRGKGGEGQEVLLGSPQHGLHLGELVAEHAGDPVELGRRLLGGRLGEDSVYA
jgi:hypothetical protein